MPLLALRALEVTGIAYQMNHFGSWTVTLATGNANLFKVALSETLNMKFGLYETTQLAAFTQSEPELSIVI
jgi:hypothetical protein